MTDEVHDVQRKAAAEVKNVIAVELRNPFAVAEPANDKSLSPMLKLNIDCFEELFECLSLTDILSLRRTCKRLKNVINYYIKEKFPAIKVGYGKEVIHADFDGILQLEPNRAKLIEEIFVCSNLVNIQAISDIEVILSQVEKLTVSGHQLDLEFLEAIPKCCTSLKYLNRPYIHEKTIGNENDWLLRTYPSLEYLEMIADGDSTLIPELKIFLELNPNVRRFSTFSTLLLHSLLGSEIKLEQLDIAVNCLLTEMEDCLNLLNRLFDQGIYKR